LHWEVAGITGNPSRGSGGGGSGRRQWPVVRGGSGRRRGRVSVRRQLASILTPLLSSCGGLRRGRSGGAAARWATEAQQWQAAEELGALGFFRQKPAAAAWGERARRRGLNRAASRLGVLAQDCTRRGSAGPRSDSGSSPSRSRGRDSPDRRDPPVSKGKGEGGRSGPRGEDGPGRSCWAARRGKRRGEERKAAGWAAQGERQKVGRANWAVREGEERPGWARLQGKREKKKKREWVGPN
jgi:hypothetical protein